MLPDTCGGDFTCRGWAGTADAACERCDTGCVGESWKSALMLTVETPSAGWRASFSLPKGQLESAMHGPAGDAHGGFSSQGLGGPDMRQDLLLITEPKRCGRGSLIAKHSRWVTLTVLLSEHCACEMSGFSQMAKQQSSWRSGAGGSPDSCHRQCCRCRRRWRGTE